jgi:hypothetical protein
MLLLAAFGLLIAMLNGCATEADRAKEQALLDLLLAPIRR